MASEAADESPRTGPAAAGAPEPAVSSEPYDGAGVRPPEQDDTADSPGRRIRRKLSRRAVAAQRFAAAAAAEEAEPRPEPENPAAAARSWGADAVRGLLDVQFRRPATRTLLPLVYLLGLAVAVAVPVVVTVVVWRVSALLGVLAALLAIPFALTIAAAVRLFLEFLVNASRLATRVEHISDLADDLFQVLSEVAEPVNQLSEDVRAVQFWRFRRGPRK
ncbi:DUF4282 domain-containing protein [Nocardia sp. NPDC003963]